MGYFMKYGDKTHWGLRLLDVPRISVRLRYRMSCNDGWELGNWLPGFNPSDQRQLEASKNGLPGLANVYKKHGKSWVL